MIRLALALLLAATVVLALVVVMRPACVSSCTADIAATWHECNGIYRGRK